MHISFPNLQFCCFLILVQVLAGSLCSGQEQAVNYLSPATSESQTSDIRGAEDQAYQKPSEARGSDAPSQTTTTEREQSSPASANGDYILGIGDTIELAVYREPDLGIRSKIGNDGMVQLPLLGEIKLAGLSVRSASSLIRQKYDADYLVNPQIYLDVIAYSSRKFTIIGQVNRPGAYDFGGSDSIDLLEAIGMSGGFTRIADRGHIKVKRRDAQVMKLIKVDARKLIDEGADRFEIKPGDVIDVGESWY